MSKLIPINLMLGSLGLGAIACFLGGSALMMSIPPLLIAGLAGAGCAIVGAGLAIAGSARSAGQHQTRLPRSNGEQES